MCDIHKSHICTSHFQCCPQSYYTAAAMDALNRNSMMHLLFCLQINPFFGSLHWSALHLPALPTSTPSPQNSAQHPYVLQHSPLQHPTALPPASGRIRGVLILQFPFYQQGFTLLPWKQPTPNTLPGSHLRLQRELGHTEIIQSNKRQSCSESHITHRRWSSF